MSDRGICKLSVIVPVHNVEQYIERCMESLLRFHYDRMEILCIDDGSTDRSGQKCDGFALRDNRVRVIHQNNKGLPAVRNMGISIAKGEYISFVDSDDWVDGCLFEDFITFMDRNSDVDICVGGSVREYPDGSRVPMFKDFMPKLLDRDEALKEMISGRRFFWYMWGKVYRRNVFEGFVADETVTTGEDLDSLWQMFRLGKVRKIWYSPQYKYYYYYNINGMTEGKKRIERHKSDLYVFEKILKDSDKENAEVLDLIRGRAIQTVYGILRECFFLNEQLDFVESYIAKGIAILDEMDASARKSYIAAHRLKQMVQHKEYAKSFFADVFSSMRKAASKAESFHKKYIYGTGTVSQYVTTFMKEKGDFDGFVLSDDRPSTLMFGGKPVYHMSELDREEQKVLVLAVNEKNRIEIMNGLNVDENTTVIIPDVPDDF